MPKIKVDIILSALFILLSFFTKAQLCTKDSNFYSLTYTSIGNKYLNDGIINTENEMVVLGHYDAFSSFVTKFTSQGSILWSNEFKPDYPHDTWVQYPWYNNTEMLGITAGFDNSCYIYGYTTEHGVSYNNVETPPTHKGGLIIHIDKYGKKISGKFLGNWRTGYTVNNLIQLKNGSLVVYLKSHINPKISKVLCLNNAGDLLWAAPVQTNTIIEYKEIDGVNPVMKQLSNGNIVVAQIMQRDIADTLRYPFLPDIILPAPLHYFNLFELNGRDGKLLWENSYQCPTLTNTNVSNAFIPQIKNITQLQNGNLSFLADMYLQLDSNERFYAYKVLSKRTANFITSADGFNLKLISYYPLNGSCTLETARETGNNGEQLLLAKDSATGNSLLFKIDNEGRIFWSKSYTNTSNPSNSLGLAIEKVNNKGYSIFNSSPTSADIKLTITDAAGNTSCSQLPVIMVTQNGVWPWLVNKVHLSEMPAIIDFGNANFSIKQNTYPLSRYIDCEYQYVCCKDFIDSLNLINAEICENQSYKLPDNTIVKDSGLYYVTFKTARGCDSILFYNVKILKLPDHLTATPDTCMKRDASIELRASEGYENYLWNNLTKTFSPKFLINSPGTYSVKVENKCGTKTDTINIYSECDFPIYFPTAFTPNRDFLNDVLKVPELNKNKFIRLSIYNRYSQLVFKTDNRKAAWDGYFKGLPQENGVYAYYLEMEGYSGKKINQKGTVVLIR